jgi:N-carbamoylputrescine amidase
MQTLKVALLQLEALSTGQEAYQTKGLEFCRRAKAAGADIAVLPEMWNVGYNAHLSDETKTGSTLLEPQHAATLTAWQAQAINRDSPFFHAYQRLARELDMAILLTYLEKWPSGPRNTASLIDRHGDVVLTYAKVHTCDFSFEAACTPGEDFPVYDLDTASGPVKVGVMICYDREFPESARILMLNGAEIILVPNACELEQNRLGQLRARAYENMTGVAVVNYVGEGYKGHSAAYSGIAFNRYGQSQDTLLVEAGTEEGIWLAEFDIALLREYREHEVWGNAYRKPKRYARLLNEDVDVLFKRGNARR